MTTAGRTYGGLDAEERHVRRREQLLAAGLERFAADGWAEATVAGICRTAGLSQRYLYEHVADREELFLAVVDRIGDEVEQVIRAAAATPDAGPVERARLVLEAIAAYFAADPRTVRVALVESLATQRFRERRRELLARFGDLATRLMRALRDGDRPTTTGTGRDREATAAVVGALLTGGLVAPEAAREPIDLIVDAARAAARDAAPTGVTELLAATDAVLTVRTTSWSYDEAAALVADRVGAGPGHRVDTSVGGHWPTRLLEAAAARIAAGESSVALLVGGEAQASLGALAKAGLDPVADAGWSSAPGGPPAFDPDDLGSPAMRAAGLVLPTRVYPMFHNALQADLGLTADAAATRSARLYARFSEVAADNPVAWNREPRSAEEIATVGPENRMICEPYPLAVNAMPHVDQAAAVLVLSTDAARAHGIPEERWVHVWGGAGATDTRDVLDRRSYATSDALEAALDRALARTGTTAEDLDVVDVYSCFPVVPELVLRHLGSPEGTTPSVTGGHAAFGGPLSSYSLHAIAAVTRRLRDDLSIAMVHANGGYLTEQHVSVLARNPHPRGYVGDPDPVAVAPDGAPPVGSAQEVLAAADGLVGRAHGRDVHRGARARWSTAAGVRHRAHRSRRPGRRLDRTRGPHRR